MAPRKQEVVPLEGSLDIRDAEDLKARLNEELKKGVSIKLDLTKLEDMDFAVLQLIYSFKKSLSAAKCKMTLEGMNEKIEKKISLCDFSELLME